MDLVGDAPRLYSFLDAATQSLTTSPKLAKITHLVELAQDLQDIDSDQIIFETVPVGAYAPDPNRVQWTPEAEEIWEAMRNDEPFPGTEPPESSKPTKTKQPSQPKTSQPKTTKPEQPPASSSSAPICAA